MMMMMMTMTMMMMMTTTTMMTMMMMMIRMVFNELPCVTLDAVVTLLQRYYTSRHTNLIVVAIIFRSLEGHVKDVLALPDLVLDLFPKVVDVLEMSFDLTHSRSIAELGHFLHFPPTALQLRHRLSQVVADLLGKTTNVRTSVRNSGVQR